MRTDSCMNPGRLHLQPKRDYMPFDDHTSTMWQKKQQMNAGIVLDKPIRYTPQHRRSARGIVAGVVLGAAVWLLLGGIAVMVWRMYGL
ncbi:MAG: hypothetical protein IPM06_20695 [Rhizobiales bacterium]|nr:hypothetical protein [Hyphomicrobiales bacterium]